VIAPMMREPIQTANSATASAVATTPASIATVESRSDASTSSRGTPVPSTHPETRERLNAV
jgi:hypothetical protein